MAIWLAVKRILDNADVRASTVVDNPPSSSGGNISGKDVDQVLGTSSAVVDVEPSGGQWMRVVMRSGGVVWVNMSVFPYSAPELPPVKDIDFSLCPVCKTHNLCEILFGKPSPKMVEAVDAGEFIAGGCAVPVSLPEFARAFGCKNCGGTFYFKSGISPNLVVLSGVSV